MLDSNADIAATELHPPEHARALIKRLPLTMRPTLNQQLHGWDSLYPYEHRRLLDFLQGMESFSPQAWQAQTRPLIDLEKKMGVERWDFSEDEDTMENASHLARSADYIEWRDQVQSLFQAIEAAAQKSAPPSSQRARLVLLILPESLPVDAPSQWKPWDKHGRIYTVAGGTRGLSERIVQELPAALSTPPPAEGSDLWLIDAGAELPKLPPAMAEQLRYAHLLPFRDRFLEQVNTIPKNIAVSDHTLNEVRHQNWERWSSDELKDQPRLRNFSVDLFLSGNGALIFSSAFVEWASSEALRRARPRALVARFGMRGKPKPFTGIAIFENQQHINTLPDVDDPEGSAIDALELARYVWLAAARYPEHEQTICLCIAERHDAVYLITPEDKTPPWSAQTPIASETMAKWITQLLAV
ncbi:hypothetical protein ACOBR2_02325 [Telmatobacter bradus]|uniref:hypothetical protein n=1 Tax=Telmatobacter bradus TaxID=474953 RepID=UPI003B4352B7